jgi:hypothetical protein
MNGRPCELAVEFDPATNTLSPSFVSDSYLPAQLAIILGDSIQNTRSALDYLVWELVLTFGGTPCERNQFPLCKNATQFKDAVHKRRLCGISEAAIDEVEVLQPYYEGEDRAADTLSGARQAL